MSDVTLLCASCKCQYTPNAWRATDVLHKDSTDSARSGHKCNWVGGASACPCARLLCMQYMLYRLQSQASSQGYLCICALTLLPQPTAPPGSRQRHCHRAARVSSCSAGVITMNDGFNAAAGVWRMLLMHQQEHPDNGAHCFGHHK